MGCTQGFAQKSCLPITGVAHSSCLQNKMEMILPDQVASSGEMPILGPNREHIHIDRQSKCLEIMKERFSHNTLCSENMVPELGFCYVKKQLNLYVFV